MIHHYDPTALIAPAISHQLEACILQPGSSISAPAITFPNSLSVSNKVLGNSSFPVSQRVNQTPTIGSNTLEDLEFLEEWAKTVHLTIGPMVPSLALQHKVLNLCYQYHHLNGIDLSNHHPTDLITHQVHLAPGAVPYSVQAQKQWSPIKEYWLC
jgi:hypothetical protein